MEHANETFDKFGCETCRVHSEAQMIHDYEPRRAKGAHAGRVHPYIRSSKLYGYHCLSFLRNYGFFDDSDFFCGREDDPYL